MQIATGCLKQYFPLRHPPLSGEAGLGLLYYSPSFYYENIVYVPGFFLKSSACGSEGINSFS
jgi:hypothetical protein